MIMRIVKKNVDEGGNNNDDDAEGDNAEDAEDHSDVEENSSSGEETQNLLDKANHKKEQHKKEVKKAKEKAAHKAVPIDDSQSATTLALVERENSKTSASTSGNDLNKKAENSNKKTSTSKKNSKKAIENSTETKKIEKTKESEKTEKIKNAAKKRKNLTEDSSQTSFLPKKDLTKPGKSSSLKLLLVLLAILSVAALIIIGYEIKQNYNSKKRFADVTEETFSEKNSGYNLIEDIRARESRMGIQNL